MPDQFNFPGLTCERFVLGPFQVNTYLVFDSESRELIVVDPAFAPAKLLDRVAQLDSSKVLIFLTHAHSDHILGVEPLKKATKAEVACSAEDAPMLTDPILNLSQFFGSPVSISPPERVLKHQDELALGSHKARVIAVPGHTIGGLALHFPKMLFSGDTLFAGSIGRSDFPGGDGKLLLKMIKDRLLSLPNCAVFPGHGPETEIAREKNENPFLSGIS